MRYFEEIDKENHIFKDLKTGAVGPLRKGRGRGWYVEDESRIPKQAKRKGYTNEEYNKQEDRISQLKREYNALLNEEMDYQKDWDVSEEPSFELESTAYDRMNKEEELREAREKYAKMGQNPYIERKLQLGQDKFNALKESNQIAKAEEDLSSLYTYRDEKNMGSLHEEPFKRYEDKYGKKVVDKAWKNLGETKDVVKGVYTDNEGLTYNQLIDKSYIDTPQSNIPKNLRLSEGDLTDNDKAVLQEAMKEFGGSSKTKEDYIKVNKDLEDAKKRVHEQYDKDFTDARMTGNKALEESARKAKMEQLADIDKLQKENLAKYKEYSSTDKYYRNMAPDDAIYEYMENNKGVSENEAWRKVYAPEIKQYKNEAPDDAVYEFAEEFGVSEEKASQILYDKSSKQLKNEQEEFEAKYKYRSDTSPMSEYSDTTGTGLSDKQMANIEIKDAPTRTSQKTGLKNKPYKEELDRTIDLGISSNSYTAGKDAEILDSISGQLSDGIWENSPGMERYWRNMDFITKDGNIQMATGSRGWYPDYSSHGGYRGGYSNAFSDKTDDEVRDYLAKKAKQIVKINMEDNSSIGKWDRNNTNRVEYMGGHSGEVTVADVYNFYDRMKGRTSKKRYNTFGKESFTSNEIDTIRAKIARFKNRKK